MSKLIIDRFDNHFYVFDNVLHRTDGPAYISADGDRQWFVHNTPCFSNKAFQKAAKLTDEEMMIVILKYGNVS